MKYWIILITMTLFMQGCVVGTIVSIPFEITGSVLNTFTPDVVGDSVSGTGEALDTIIPF